MVSEVLFGDPWENTLMSHWSGTHDALSFIFAPLLSFLCSTHEYPNIGQIDGCRACPQAKVSGVDYWIIPALLIGAICLAASNWQSIRTGRASCVFVEKCVARLIFHIKAPGRRQPHSTPIRRIGTRAVMKRVARLSKGRLEFDKRRKDVVSLNLRPTASSRKQITAFLSFWISAGKAAYHILKNI